MLVTDIHGIDSAWTKNESASGIAENGGELLGSQAVECAPFPPLASLVDINAFDLRNLIVKHANSQNGGRYCLRGCRIRGRLILDDLTGPGGCSLPGLMFTQCLFDSGICFAGTRVANISLRGSRFCVDRDARDNHFGNWLLHIDGRCAAIEGNLDISHVRPLRDDGGALPEDLDILGADTLLATFADASVGGSVYASFSTFAEEADKAQAHANSIGMKSRALSFSGMHVRNGLTLNPGFRIEGGFVAGDLFCEGEAWLTGADISDQYRTANQSGNTGVADCALSFQSAVFRSLLVLSHNHAPRKPNAASSQVSTQTKIIGSVNLHSVEAKGIYLHGVSIRNGSFSAYGLKADSLDISTPEKKKRKLPGEKSKEIQWDAGLNLNNVKLDTLQVTLEDASVGSLACAGSTIGKLVVDADKIEKVDLKSLRGKSVDLKGGINDIDMSDSIVDGKCEISCESKNVYLNRTKIGGDLDLKKWTTLDSKSWPRLILNRLSVAGSIDVGTVEKGKHVKALAYELSCYRNYKLFISEARLRKEYNAAYADGPNAFVAYLQEMSGSDLIRLDGKSHIFHRLNANKQLDISSAEKAVQYLILFTAFTWGEEGPFRIVTADELYGDGSNVDLKNRARPVLTCDRNGEKRKSEVVGEVVAYSSLDDLMNRFGDDIVCPAQIGSGAETHDSMFLQEIQNFFSLGPRGDAKDDDLHDASKYQWLIPATILYGKAIFIALFGLSADNPGDIRMLVDFGFCFTAVAEVENAVAADEESEEENRDKEEGRFVYPLTDYPRFVQRDGGQGALIEVSVDAKGSAPTTETYLPPNFFKGRELKGQDAQNVFWSAWGRSRKALVDLSDAQCELLDDGSGRGWGDLVMFQTDRFRFNSLLRRDSKVQSEFSWDGNDIHIKEASSQQNILAEFLVAPDELESRIRNNQGVNYTNTPGLTFYEERLLWLCRYHNFNVPTAKTSSHVDGGAFRRVARVYRNLGLREGAKYIDEARIRKENLEARESLVSRDWSISGPQNIALLLTLGLCVWISAVNGFEAWAIAAGTAALGALVWSPALQFLAKKLVRSSVTLWDTLFRVCFRYGLSLSRPVWTVFVFLLVGWWVTQYLEANHFLVVDTTIVAQGLGEKADNIDAPIVSFSGLSPGKKASDVLCGSTIDAGLYALDIFIPLVDLDQEERCLIRPFDPSPPRNDIPYTAIFSKPWYLGKAPGCPADRLTFCDLAFPLRVIVRHPTTWRMAQAFYVLTGWMIISATLLTFSGYLRRHAEGEE